MCLCVSLLVYRCTYICTRTPTHTLLRSNRLEFQPSLSQGPLKDAAVTELHKLFKWAKTSRKGLILFIDEAESFLGQRRSHMGSSHNREGHTKTGILDGSTSSSVPNHSEAMRNALNAFLYQTGEQSEKFMMVSKGEYGVVVVVLVAVVVFCYLYCDFLCVCVSECVCVLYWLFMSFSCFYRMILLCCCVVHFLLCSFFCFCMCLFLIFLEPCCAVVVVLCYCCCRCCSCCCCRCRCCCCCCSSYLCFFIFFSWLL